MTVITTGQQTHASQIVTQLEYVEESVQGVMPTSPTMTFLAESAVWAPKFTVAYDEFRRHGSEDPYKYNPGTLAFESTLTFGISNTAFLKYGINSNTGLSGTIAKSLSIGFSYYLAGSQVWYKMTSSRIKSIALSIDPKDISVKCTATLEHYNMGLLLSDYIGGGTHATPDTNYPWSFATGGALPFSWNGNAYANESFDCTVTRTLSSKYINGQRTLGFQWPVLRKTAGDFTNEYLDSSMETDMLNQTPRTLIYTLSTGVSTLTFANAVLTDLSGRDFDAGATDSLVEKYGFNATSVTIT